MHTDFGFRKKRQDEHVLAGGINQMMSEIFFEISDLLCLLEILLKISVKKVQLNRESYSCFW